MERILVVQTAFIGDVVLATPVIEFLNQRFPASQIDILVRKGNESLFDNHPFLNEVILWEKRNHKYLNLVRVMRIVRSKKYSLVINLQRFLSTGLLTVLAGATMTAGFDKNPLSLFFSLRLPHDVNGKHEVERNLYLVKSWGGNDSLIMPKIYPSQLDFSKVEKHIPYICIAPTSVWHTKQWPKNKWVELLDKINQNIDIFLIGSKADYTFCEEIIQKTKRDQTTNLAGQLSLLQSAALMKNAVMNFVNDSAPLHLASAVNAPVSAIFCSTVPEFGFGPLSDKSYVFETREKLSCRPCGLHGKKECPQGHFACSNIAVESLLPAIS